MTGRFSPSGIITSGSFSSFGIFTSLTGSHDQLLDLLKSCDIDDRLAGSTVSSLVRSTADLRDPQSLFGIPDRLAGYPVAFMIVHITWF